MWDTPGQHEVILSPTTRLAQFGTRGHSTGAKQRMPCDGTLPRSAAGGGDAVLTVDTQSYGRADTGYAASGMPLSVRVQHVATVRLGHFFMSKIQGDLRSWDGRRRAWKKENKYTELDAETVSPVFPCCPWHLASSGVMHTIPCSYYCQEFSSPQGEEKGRERTPCLFS